MGYYVRTEEVETTLPADKLDEAYKRLCQLDLHDEWKRGGGDGESWFSWLSKDYTIECKTAQEILEAVGYEITVSPNGDLSIDCYDNKTGCEDVFLWAISDLFAEGGRMIWVGEDSERWLWEFGGGKRVVQSVSETIYTNPTPFVPTDWRAVTEAVTDFFGGIL
jgi:hypothetical protein